MGQRQGFRPGNATFRDLTDNQGSKACVLEKPERFSVWGKIHLQQLSNDTARNGKLP